VANLREIDSYLTDLLDAASFHDVSENGIQVPGRTEVRRVVTGVSATRDLLRQAVEREADLVLVHHGIFWTFDRGRPSDVTLERLRLLLAADVGLIAQHLPLDAHPEHGNNALLCEALGADRHEPYRMADGTLVGRIAHFDGEGIAVDALTAHVHEVLGQKPLRLDGGPARVRRAAIVSGAAADDAGHAAQQGCDLLLTGEPRERTQAEAREWGITVLAAGHHATETRGVRRLGDLLADRFGIEHVFVDVPNPV
jgi:dinuclear metal center YbgI/SA1388 family protein